MTAVLEPNPTGTRTTAPPYRCASVDQIITGTRPPAPPITSALAASAEAKPTGTRRRHLHPCRLRQAISHRTRMTPAHSRCWRQIPPAHERPRLVIAAPLWAKIPPARGLQPRRWLHPQKTPPVTSILAASAKPNPTGTRMTPAHSRCFPGAKSHRHTNDRASVSLRLCGPNPAGTRPPAPPVTSALAAIQPEHSPTVKAVPAIQPASRAISPPAALARYAANDRLRYAVNSAKLGTLETGHVLGGACAVCCKLGPAVCGKRGTLETGSVPAGNSAGRPPVRPFPGQWRLHGMLQTWYTSGRTPADPRSLAVRQLNENPTPEGFLGKKGVELPTMSSPNEPQTISYITCSRGQGSPQPKAAAGI